MREEIGAGLNAVIVNPSGVLGPNDFGGSRMGRTLRFLAQGRLPALIEGGFDWVDVRDVSASIVAAMTRGRTGESYLLGGRWGPISELAALVGRASGRRAPRWTTPRWLAERTAGAAEWAQGAIGMDPLYTAEGLHALYGGSRHVSWAKAARGHQPPRGQRAARLAAARRHRVQHPPRWSLSLGDLPELPWRDDRVAWVGGADLVRTGSRVLPVHHCEPPPPRPDAPRVVPPRVPGLSDRAEGADPGRHVAPENHPDPYASGVQGPRSAGSG